jgi:hypothetical protein
MPRKISERDPIAAYSRKAKTKRRLGENAACICSEKRPEALVRKNSSVMCAACVRKSQRKIPADKHHVAGKANHPATIEVPVNDHRACLSVTQYNWPKKTLENSDESLLLAAAACIRGFVDTVVYLVKELLVWIADMLETLDAYLIEQFGPKWWLNTPLTIFARTRKGSAREAQ